MTTALKQLNLDDSQRQALKAYLQKVCDENNYTLSGIARYIKLSKSSVIDWSHGVKFLRSDALDKLTKLRRTNGDLPFDAREWLREHRQKPTRIEVFDQVVEDNSVEGKIKQILSAHYQFLLQELVDAISTSETGESAVNAVGNLISFTVNAYDKTIAQFAKLCGMDASELEAVMRSPQPARGDLDAIASGLNKLVKTDRWNADILQSSIDDNKPKANCMGDRCCSGGTRL